MNNAAEAVFCAIRAQICGQEFHINGEVTESLLQEIYTLSRRQDIVHIVAAELFSQKLLEQSEVRELFKKQQFMALYRHERMRHELQKICHVLDEAGIPYMPLKGSVMRQYYPEPWMRTSADVDILVRPENVDAAANALVRVLNYQNHGTDDHDIQLFAPNGVHLELHFEMVEDYRLPEANKVLKEIWDEHAFCTKGQHYAMSDEMFYFYHIAHMAKHFQEGGCGIRFFLDMWILNHNMEYDKEKRTTLLKAGELLDFAENAERLSEVWFGNQSHTEITKRMEQYILNGGVYGSMHNRIATKSVSHGGKFGYAKYLLFRPIHELRRQYPILYKHKWLYAICQVHRWFCLIFNGGIIRAKGILNRGVIAYEKNGDSVEQMLKDLKLGGKGKR